MTEKAYEFVTFGEPSTGVLEIPEVAIEGIWRFSEMSIEKPLTLSYLEITFSLAPVILAFLWSFGIAAIAGLITWQITKKTERISE